MAPWIPWWKLVRQLRPAFARETTFLWFALCLVGLTIRPNLRGVTSIIRALGLKVVFYDWILDFFPQPSGPRGPPRRPLGPPDSDPVACLPVPKVNDRPVLIGDGIKLAKTGRKMPAVKKLHQQSTNNTKPEFIYGHSCQAIALLVGCAQSFFALPLTCRIHEGLVLSNRQTKSLLDKMINLVRSLTISIPLYLVLDAYYASKVIVHGLPHSGSHLITQVRKNAVAYRPALPNSEKRRGPKRKYVSSLIEAPSPAYGQTRVTIRYRPIDLLWRPVGILVRFVLVIHPQHGSKIFMTTDLSLSPLDILRIYGFRFKIEVAFKQALYTLGTYAYHFWMAAMTPRPNKSGDQYLHRKSQAYRDLISRKMRAYHCHMQLGIIAQGLLQYLSLTCTKAVWRSFGSRLRTIRDGIYPSEQVTALALRNTLPELLVNSTQDITLVNFIRQKIDSDKQEGLRLIAA